MVGQGYIPDQEVYHQATGEALKTVNAHKDSAPFKLYAGWFCPYVQRVWLILEERKIPYQYQEVNPYKKPESLLKLNPRGLVPTIEYENKPLYESNVLLELLEEAYPKHEPHLMPKDLYKRARVRIWVDWSTSRFIPAFQRLLQHQPMDDNDEDSQKELQKKREEMHAVILDFANEIDEEGPFFMGEELTLVDFALIPFANRLWTIEHFKGGLRKPEQGGEEYKKDEKAWKKWDRWTKEMNKRESLKMTTSEREHYVPLYENYAKNEAQSELAKAIRAGKPAP